MKKTALSILLLMTVSLVLSGADGPGEESKLKLFFAERTRLTTFDNSINLDEGLDDTFAFTRHRTNIGFVWTPRSDMEFMVKLTNEFRSWLSPKNRANNFNEIFFDQLYLKWKKVAGTGLTLTVGRQNIFLGEGFVCLDGQPLTGSRSAYFNAVRADYVFNKAHKITAFVSYVPHTDNWLPVINESDPGQPLEEQANTGIGLYYQGHIRNVGVHAYFFRKDTHANDAAPVESGINTLGARVTLPLAKMLTLTAEGAVQNGSLGTADRKAFGGHFHLDWAIKGSLPVIRVLTLGGILLSGDDPGTADYEGWEPLWSRWPKWSESYIYTLIRESGVARWTNIRALYLGVKAALGKDLNANLNYYFLGAPEDGVPTPAFAGLMGEGNWRGGLLVSRVNYTINRHLSGHFVWEHFAPGSYYRDGADAYNWFRFELMIKY